MQLTQVGYGGCWKCLHAWQRCSASTPCLVASQKGFVHSFGTGIGLVTRLQSLIDVSFPIRSDRSTECTAQAGARTGKHRRSELLLTVSPNSVSSMPTRSVGETPHWRSAGRRFTIVGDSEYASCR